MKKALGVLGGMGPQATVDFLQKVINLTKIQREQDHIRIYTDIHPQIPDRISAILGDGEKPLPYLAESLKKLENAGAKIIVMPCITVHYYFEALNEYVDKANGVEFINLLEALSAACENNYPGKTAGILSTVATKESGILKKELKSKGINYTELNESQQDKMTELILRVKANDDTQSITKEFAVIIEEMREKGADYFALGCTEIPIIVNAYDFPYPVVDSTLELAKAAVVKCGYELKS